MSRLLAAQSDPTAISDILASESFETAMCAEFQFKSETMRICNRNVGFTDSDGQKWTAGSDWVNVSDMSGGSENLGTYLEYTLSIPSEVWDSLEPSHRNTLPSVVSDSSEYRGRKVILSLQIFDEEGIVGDRIILDTSFMNKPRLSVTPKSATLRIFGENLFATKRKPPFGYLTNGDQQYRFPSEPLDTGLLYVPTTAARPVDWTNSNA